MSDKEYFKTGLRLAVSAAAIAAAVSCVEKNLLSNAVYTVPDSHKTESGARIVFLSDLHEKEFGDANFRLIDMIHKASPDMILIGGDMPVIKQRACREVSLSLIKTLAGQYPVYYGRGNHELRWDRDRGVYGDSFCDYRRELEESGVVFLDKDSTERFACFGKNIRIYGLDLEERHYHRFTHDELDISYVREQLGDPDPSCYNIVMVHSPEFHETLVSWGADLVLSGHFHGGTVRLPGGVGLMTPQYQFFRDNVTGIKYIGNVPMIISSGLGTHSINIRINDRPQVVTVDLIHR